MFEIYVGITEIEGICEKVLRTFGPKKEVKRRM
jgi:hypothetical protein